jgi:hypothetical protein
MVAGAIGLVVAIGVLVGLGKRQSLPAFLS